MKRLALVVALVALTTASVCGETIEGLPLEPKRWAVFCVQEDGSTLRIIGGVSQSIAEELARSLNERGADCWAREE